MALIIKDRVKEGTTTSGTGDITLAGSSFATFVPFNSYMTNGDTSYYAIEHTSSGIDEWEVGLGTWNTGNTLSRTTVLAGSAGTSAVDFSAGTKNIFMTYPSAIAAFTDGSGDLSSLIGLGNHTTTDVAEGSNLYFTTGRIDSHLSGGTGVTYNAGAISVGQAVATSSNVTFNTVTLGGNPATALQAATKEYVDTIAAAGIHYHELVRVEAAANRPATYDNGTAGVGATLTNSGTQEVLVIDGVTVNVADRVLLQQQTNSAHNGIYTVTNVGSASTNWVLTRAVDADSYHVSDKDALGEGDAFFIKEGLVSAGDLYVMNTSGVITFGTTPITFTVIAETAIYTAGTGLTLTGTEFATVQDIATTASPTFVTVNANLSGNVTGNVTGNISGSSGSTTGNAATATKLATARTVQLSGDVTGSASFDGSANINITATVGDDSHAHIISNVDGLQTALDSKVDDSQSITAGTGLTGGGDLTVNRTLSLDTTYTDTRYVNATGDTMTGALINTRANDASTGGGQIYLNGATGNRIDFNTPGVAAPTFTTRSAGTKIVLYPAVAAASADYALGIESGTLWSSVPETQYGFKWYGGTTLAMTLSGTGTLTATTFSGALSGNATTATTLQTARTINGVSFNGSANITVADGTKLPLAGGAITGAITTTSTFDGRDVSVDGTKLDTIATSANNYSFPYTVTSTGTTASSVAQRDGSADLHARLFRSTYATTNANIPYIMTQVNQSTDNYIRPSTPAQVRSALNVADGANNYSFPYTVSAAAGNSTVVQRDANGYILGVFFNGTGTFATNGEASGMGRFTGTNGTDTYGRSFTAAAARTLLNVADGATNVTNTNQLTNGAGYITSDTTKLPLAGGTMTGNTLVNNYGIGNVGLYSATRYQAVFAMGDAYKLPADGSTTGSLYGIAWTHSNIGGQSKAGLSHQALFIESGVTKTAIGTGIWTSGTVTAPTFSGALSGNATTASTLQTARTINGVSFNGSANITVADSTKVPTSGFSSATNAQFYFKANQNTTVSNPPLQVYSDNNGGAIMAFHRGGYYAVNMGLDSDNVFRIGGWSASANRLQMDMSGNLTMAGNVTAYSDVRLKSNIQTIESGLDKVCAMRGVTFEKDGVDGLGVIAQEMEAIIPEVVMTQNDGMKSVAYGNIVGVLIEAIKELKLELDNLKASLNGE